jgi:hypothetical protein
MSCCKKIVTDEMTFISMKKYLTEVNYSKYEIIWQNMQEKYLTYVCASDRNIRPQGPRNI